LSDISLIVGYGYSGVSLKGIKAASHRIRLRLTIRLTANDSLLHMQQEHHHRQSGLLKTILSKPEASRNRENSPGYGQRSLCEDCRWP